MNLFLQVVGKEERYHHLYSLMQTIGFGDEITVEHAPEDQLICNVPHLQRPDNLLWRALLLFREHTGWKESLRVTLHKRIPEQMGLGGGSSNAATMLYAMNQLAGFPLRQEELQALSSQLGSDLPFFFL